MGPEEVVELYSLLEKNGVQLWVDGGWGIDALLGEQTRPHKDLDTFVRAEDLATMTRVLARLGFTLKWVWPESRWMSYPQPVHLIAREDAAGEVATAFVLHDTAGRELDIHVLTFDERAHGVPAWNTEFRFPPGAFDGRGAIAGTPVRCLSAQAQIFTHSGYELQDKDRHDLQLLQERFGVEYPS